MFEPQQDGGLSKHEITFQALRDKATGDVIAYEDLPYEGKVSQAKVRKLMEREQKRSIVTVRGEGWRIVTGSEQVNIVERDRRRSLRWMGRALHTAGTVDRREMSGEDRQRADAQLIKATQGYGALRGVAARRLGLDDIKAWNDARRRGD